MQTILGAGGAIGLPLAKELSSFTTNIRLVSRKPVRVNETDELFAADLMNATEVDRAIQGSSIVYLVAGITYDTKTWQQQWPVIMQNVLEACIKHSAKLVFFDNNYMYDKDYFAKQDEQTPIKPCSKKGEVRAAIANMIWNEVNAGKLEAMIVRAADFIAAKNSVLVEMVYKNLAKGKKATWFGDVNKIHSFTFTPDAAKATALLGNTPAAYNQVWHAPSINHLTGLQWIHLLAEALQAKPEVRTMPPFMISLLGLFIPVLKEFKEMAYQFRLDYVFDCNKIKHAFHLEPTPVDEVVKWLKEHVQVK